MSFILNNLTVDSKAKLSTLTLHETQGRQNRVVYVVVPNTAKGRLTAAQAKANAKADAKKALQAAAKSL